MGKFKKVGKMKEVDENCGGEVPPGPTSTYLIIRHR